MSGLGAYFAALSLGFYAIVSTFLVKSIYHMDDFVFFSAVSPSLPFASAIASFSFLASYIDPSASKALYFYLAYQNWPFFPLG